MSFSSVNPSIQPLKPTFDPSSSSTDSSETQALIKYLNLEPHPEGGYYTLTDADPLRVPNPFAISSTSPSADDSLVSSRQASTSIFYLLTPARPLGVFHRNRARTVHTLHKGRGRYVIIHADEVANAGFNGGYGDESRDTEAIRWTGKARVETFVVGTNVLEGERLQWIVEGGKYKASFLLPDEEGGGEDSGGLLISETVVPGFDWADHDFMRMERLVALVTRNQRDELEWMVKKTDGSTVR